MLRHTRAATMIAHDVSIIKAKEQLKHQSLENTSQCIYRLTKCKPKTLKDKKSTHTMDSSEYFKKSYFALDGLWFLMVEEDTSFEHALELDKKVWKVMAKIQARTAKKLGKKFFDSLKLKWDSEGYKYHLEKYTVVIDVCPWWDIMKNSGRDDQAGRVGAAICPIIYNEWIREYKAPYIVKFETHMCQGDKTCNLLFQEKSVE